MQNAESRDSRRSRFTSVLARFEANTSAPRNGNYFEGGGGIRGLGDSEFVGVPKAF
jgi:hypothetical protein